VLVVERPRYKVATCTGYRIGRRESAGGGGNALGLSAHILDCWNCHRVVRTYATEDVNARPPRTKGHARTLVLAAAECDRLNRQQARA
jgi:hypothetical protein